MTIRHHRILWFLAIYGSSLAAFAGMTLLIRTVLRWMV
jgi:hypothetical protein